MKQFDVTNVAGMIRLDLIDEEAALGHTSARFCRIVDLRTARELTLLLIYAIQKAEVEEATAKKGKRK